jgi:CPA1 family monovalent cation:H+ antiporter
MRGTVTLAAALALPIGDDAHSAFPYRDFILFSAFCVVLVTLVFQGMTLSPLIRLLALDDDGAVEHEVRLAREAAAKAGLDALDASEPSDGEASLIRRKYELRLRRFQAEAEASDARADDPATLNPVARAQEAERRAVLDLRARGVIGDDAFHRVEEELDWAELNADAKSR